MILTTDTSIWTDQTVRWVQTPCVDQPTASEPEEEHVTFIVDHLEYSIGIEITPLQTATKGHISFAMKGFFESLYTFEMMPPLKHDSTIEQEMFWFHQNMNISHKYFLC